MRGTQDTESLPPPRAKHSLVNVDHDYLEVTASAYVEKKGLGRVYDPSTHRKKNDELAKRKEEKRRAQEVVEAAKIEMAYQSRSDKAFDEWKAQKSISKEVQSVIKSSALVQRKSEGKAGSEKILMGSREAQWMRAFGSAAVRAKISLEKESGLRKESSDQKWKSTSFA